MAGKSNQERIAFSQRELDRLKLIAAVAEGTCTQSEAACLLGYTPRHVRRLVERYLEEGDQALRHALRGQPSNRRHSTELRQQVLDAYRTHFADFGPTLAREKLAERDLHVGLETLRRWLSAEGLWQPRRQRDPHRRRRPRRDCFGELVQMDTSLHDWLEGRGEAMVLVNMIDDASSRILSGFYEGETVVAHLDLLGRWLRRFGRPVALYTDRDSIFEYQSKGRGDPEGLTQFGRALAELDSELILARSPQAKGRVERFFETAQDRWVKEMRLAGLTTRQQANAFTETKLIPEFNRRFTVPPASPQDAHRPLGRHHNLAAILSVQHERVVTGFGGCSCRSNVVPVRILLNLPPNRWGPCVSPEVWVTPCALPSLLAVLSNESPPWGEQPPLAFQKGDPHVKQRRRDLDGRSCALPETRSSGLPSCGSGRGPRPHAR